MDVPSRNEITITYSPRGALAEVFSRRDPEIVVAGPAGTGKSRAWLEKMHLICQKYPGARCLFLRKTLASLTTSGLVTYAEQVLHPADGVEYFGGSKREPAMYKYPNGAKLVIGGLDNAGKVLSTEYDHIYVMECNQITHSEWQKLTTRMRAMHMPYRQLAGDCNPDAPNHWIKRRESAGHLALIESRHEDNPIYWDAQKGEWTERGKEYIARLDSLEGVELQRFRYGRWVAAEGTVYNNWDSTVHVIEPFRIPASWRRIRVIDFGYTNPFVCFDDKTEVLTENGWYSFSQIIGEQEEHMKVATVNTATHEIEYQEPTSYIEQWYEGPMVASEPSEQGANFCVTPNHKMVTSSWKTDEWKLEDASDLKGFRHRYIPTGWNPSSHQDGNEPLILPGTRSDNGVNTNRSAFARFLGLFLAEGCLYEQHVKSIDEKRCFVRIAQKHDPQGVREILKAIGVRWSEYTNKNGVIDFRIRNKPLYSFLEILATGKKSQYKSIPATVLEWGADSLEALLEGLMLGDGCHDYIKDDGTRKTSKKFFTTSRQLADDVQEIACKLGIASMIRMQERITPFCPNGTKVYTVALHSGKKASIGKLTIEERQYKGFVRCVTVPNGTLVVRRGGRPMVCGNCLWIALDEDGRMYVYRQHYMSQKIVSEHAKIINRYDQDVHFDATIADHDAEDRATLHSQGIRTIPAKKAITVGIQAVEKRMRRAGDGKPRLFVFRDSLLKIDPRMEGKGKATCLEEEMDMYVWPLTKDDKPIKEAPVDDNNHALDCLRYGVMYADGPMRRAAPLSMEKESVWIEASAGY